MALTYTGQAQTGKRQREAIDDDNGSRLRKSANVGKAADSDDSDDDDLDAREVYTELKEDLPKHPMYDDETIGIAKRCQARVMQVEMILSKSKCATDRVRGFRQKAANIRVVPKPKLVQIAVLGDSGVGQYLILSSATQSLTSYRKERYVDFHCRQARSSQRGKAHPAR